LVVGDASITHLFLLLVTFNFFQIALATNVCQDAPSCSISRDTIICGCACVIWGLTGAATLCLDKLQPAKQVADDDASEDSSRVAPAQEEETAAEQPPIEPQNVVPKRRTKQKSSAGKDPTTPFPSEESKISECCETPNSS
jgi:hypothetical protein